MNKLYPLTFIPIFKERVWGGRRLETLYSKPLPPNTRVGESWEISDRPGDENIIANGEFSGKSIRWLMENFEKDLLGDAKPTQNGRFPLLIKILDACEDLSLQVHPPADIAAQLGGEPKTEMWYVTHSEPGSVIYAGLKDGVSKDDFEKKLKEGTLQECLTRFEVKEGDAIFIPSGRVHGLGKGIVIFEIQQNSDTTYRVYDWNRVGLDGRPRQLHIEEAFKSINFKDYSPQLIKTKYSQSQTFKIRYLVDDKLFRVNACRVKRGARFKLSSETVHIVGVLKGCLGISYENVSVELKCGQFCLIPAAVKQVSFTAQKQTEFLHIQAF
ncbi:MAG: type I phosphomannose isomerase catalytic subunit [Limisphaerales bacterium]|jgi:mannose-6-phosphate isomerase